MLKIESFSSSAVVRLNDSSQTLPACLDAEIDRLWQDEQALRGEALFNGKIFSAVEVTPDTVLGQIVEYRFFIAQRAKPELFEVLNVRPVAVSGLLECKDGVVFGRRSGLMTQDPGLWELCPSGGLDTGKAHAGDTVDYLGQVLTELHEEIGITTSSIASIRPFCLVDDLESHVIDLGIALSSPLSANEVVAIHLAAATKVYDEMLVVSHDDLAQFLEDKRGQLVVVSAALLGHIAR